MDQPLCLLTGATGFLGSRIASLLLSVGYQVRALVLPNDPLLANLPGGAEAVFGSVTDEASLDRFFAVPNPGDAVLIHAAAIITMALRHDPKAEQVNLVGTSNIVKRCVACGIGRLVYVSSVHALKEAKKGQTTVETTAFHPDLVKGVYAKTKAGASAMVIDAMINHGLNAVIVHPSGILGEGSDPNSNLGKTLTDYLNHRLPVGIRGGYNFVDVKDVAEAVVTLAVRRDLVGPYLLPGHIVSIREMFSALHKAGGCTFAPVRVMLPTFLMYPILPFIALVDRIRKRKAVFSCYALYTLKTNPAFSCQKAARDFGYAPRPFEETMQDVVAGLIAAGKYRP